MLSVSSSNDNTPQTTMSDEDASLGDVIDYVKAYAQQETIGPLKGAGRWLGFGFGGAFALGLGLMFVLLGVLRLLQTEFDSWATTGPWSWTAYLIVFAISSILLYLTIKRIQQDNLSKEPK
jgi:hypothetical protein